MLMKKVELVFIPAPSVGHLGSTIELAKRLIDRDDRISVTILAIKKPTFSSSDSNTASPKIPFYSQIKIVDVPQAEHPPQEFLKTPFTFFSLYIENHKQQIKNIVTDLLSNSTQLAGLVVDFFCVSMIDVANELYLPTYLFMTGNAGYLSLMLYCAISHSPTDTYQFLTVPGIAKPIPPKVFPSSLVDGSYSAYMKTTKRFRETDGIMVNTFSELEPFALSSFLDGKTPPVYPIGPLINFNGNTELINKDHHDKIMSWLDEQSQSSVVLLCFGSMGSFEASQVKEIALGLEHSEQRFLWSLSLTKGNDPNSNLNPNDDFPEGFLERTKGKGMVCEWVPQVEVLAHEAIGGFVSHCGWNSILESLWHGVPVVTWPMYAEQQLNAFRMVKELGLAEEVSLDYRKGCDMLVKEDEIERAVRVVMNGNSEVRKRVKEMGEIARNTVTDDGSSFIVIGRLIEDITKNHIN